MSSPALALIGSQGEIEQSTHVFRRRYEERADLWRHSPELESVLAGVSERASVRVDGVDAQLEAVTDGRGVRHALMTMRSGEAVAAPTGPNELLTEPLDESRALIWLKDLDGRYLRVNRRFTEFLGSTTEALRGRTEAELDPRMTVDGHRAHELNPSLPEPLELEYSIPAFEGRPAMVALRFAVRDQNGQPVAVCGVAAPVEEGGIAREETAWLTEVERCSARDASAVRFEMLQEWGVVPLAPAADTARPAGSWDGSTDEPAGAARPEIYEVAPFVSPAPPAFDPEREHASHEAEQSRAEAEAARTEAEAARTEADAARHESAEALLHAERLERDAEQWRQQAEQAQADRAALRARLEQAEAEVHHLRARLEEAEDYHRSLRARLDEAEADHRTLRARLEENELMMVEARRRTEQAEAERARADAARLEAEAARAHAEAALTEAESVRGELESVRGELQSARGEAESARGEAESARAELDSARAEAESARGELESARAEAESVRGELESARAEAESARGDLQSVRHTLAASNEELAALRGEAERMRASDHAARADLDRLRSDFEDARRDASESLARVRAERDAALGDSAELRRALEQHQAAAAARHASADRAEALAGALRAERERVDELMRALTGETPPPLPTQEEAHARPGPHWTVRAQRALVEAMSGSSEWPEALDRALAAIGTEGHWNVVNAWTRDEFGSLRCSASWTAPADGGLVEFASLGQRLGAGSVLGQAVHGMAVTWLSDLEGTADERLAAAAAHGLRCAVLLPIRVGASTIGLLELLTRTELPPDPAMALALETAAIQIGRFAHRLAPTM